WLLNLEFKAFVHVMVAIPCQIMRQATSRLAARTLARQRWRSGWARRWPWSWSRRRGQNDLGRGPGLDAAAEFRSFERAAPRPATAVPRGPDTVEYPSQGRQIRGPEWCPDQRCRGLSSQGSGVPRSRARTKPPGARGANRVLGPCRDSVGGP